MALYYQEQLTPRSESYGTQYKKQSWETSDKKTEWYGLACLQVTSLLKQPKKTLCKEAKDSSGILESGMQKDHQSIISFAGW